MGGICAAIGPDHEPSWRGLARTVTDPLGEPVLHQIA
jgi:hypothetical protein